MCAGAEDWPCWSRGLALLEPRTGPAGAEDWPLPSREMGAGMGAGME